MADQEGQYQGKQFGSYRLLKLLGEGGFAEVYLGEHIHLGTHAAVKVLTTKLTEDEVAQFRNEARTMIGLKHPHIIRVLDFGLVGRIPFIIMDYAPNKSLRDIHPRGTRLPLPTIVNYVKQIAHALQYVHDQKLIHRDIKSENMLLSSNNEVLLSDFGIAAVAHSTRSLNTRDGSGTIYYMSPEQIQGKPRTASDQYSLAVVVYEWLCGERPFNGTYWEIASQHLHAPPSSLREKIRTIPPDVEQVVMIGLAKDPKQRFGSVQAFARALEEASKKPVLGTTLVKYSGHSTSVYAVSWAPNGQYIVSVDDKGNVQIWNTNTGSSIYTYSNNYCRVNDASWSPNGRFIAFGSFVRDLDTLHSQITENYHPLDVREWNETTKLLIPVFSFPRGVEDIPYMLYPGIVEWSPDGQYIAVAWDDEVVVLNISNKHVLTYRGHSTYEDRLIGDTLIHDVAWSPDGKYIASCGWQDSTVHVWNPFTGSNIFTYRGHSSPVIALAWSPNRKYVASASTDRTVQVWDTTRGNCICNYLAHSNGVNDVTWSPDGARIASASANHTVGIWNATNGTNIVTIQVS